MAVSKDDSHRCAETLARVDLQDLEVDAPVTVKALNDGEFRPMSDEPSAAEFLSSGNGFFSFTCATGTHLVPEARELVRLIVNLSRFENEEKENFTPPFDSTDDELMKDHHAFVVKATYGLPGLDPSKLTGELLSSVEYHKKCQPGPPSVDDDPDLVPSQTVRFTKTIVKLVFHITVQLTVSVITDAAVLDSLAGVDGKRPTHAVLMERTKKDVHKQDSTIKCKSLLLYYAVEGGLVCTNISIVINSTIPHVVASVVNSFGNSGASEVKETITKSRRYLIDINGDTRDTEGKTKTKALANEVDGSSDDGGDNEEETKTKKAASDEALAHDSDKAERVGGSGRGKGGCSGSMLTKLTFGWM